MKRLLLGLTLATLGVLPAHAFDLGGFLGDMVVFGNGSSLYGVPAEHAQHETDRQQKKVQQGHIQRRTERNHPLTSKQSQWQSTLSGVQRTKTDSADSTDIPKAVSD